MSDGKSLGKLINKTTRHKYTNNLIYHILVFSTAFLIWGLASIYLMSHELMGKIDLVMVPLIVIFGYIWFRREHPIYIYEKGIKFPFYWKLKCGKQFLLFREIKNIKERHTSKKSRFSGTKLITKDGRKYFVLQYYENEVLPYIPDEIFKRAKER